MYLGCVDGKRRCNVSRNALNNAVLITGGSGAGKSARMHTIEMECAKENATIIVPDAGFTHCQEHLFPLIMTEYMKYVNRIDVGEHGLNLNLFRGENFEISIRTLGNYYKMGPRQIEILRKSASMIRDVPSGGDDLAILNLALQRCGGQVLLEKMQSFLTCGVVRQNNSRIQPGAINIIDLSLLETDVQKLLLELILAHSWGYLQKSRGKVGHVVISLDEIQNLALNRRDSPLHQMLREGRKFKVSFLLATQTLSNFSPDAISVLNQAATHLYFRPPVNEVGKIAHMIEADKQAIWCRKLAKLEVGQCVATGNFSVNGVAVNHPLILR